MKYLKQYENIWGIKIPTQIYEYNENDYVLLNVNNIRKDQNFYEETFNVYKNYGIITKTPVGVKKGKLQRLYDISYIDSNSFELKILHSCYILEESIIRKLTPIEIEEIEAILTANKYNL